MPALVADIINNRGRSRRYNVPLLPFDLTGELPGQLGVADRRSFDEPSDFKRSPHLLCEYDRFGGQCINVYDRSFPHDEGLLADVVNFF